jgi:hypothetical protein
MNQPKPEHVLAFAAIGVLIVLGFISSVDTSIQALVWILAASTILFRSFVCLILMLMTLFFGNYASYAYILDQLTRIDILRAFLVVAFVALSLRYLDVSKISITHVFWNKLKDQDGNYQANIPSTQTNDRFRVWNGFAFAIVISVTAAIVLLEFLPVERFEGNRFRQNGSILRLITLFWIFGLAWLMANTIFAIIRVHKMSAQQAKITLLRTFEDELGREQNAIESRIEKNRN